MDARKLLVAAVAVFLVAGATAQYTGSGDVSDGPPETACNDGSDNDGDGRVDGTGNATHPADPGCVKPYWLDDSENNVYDLDMSWVFSGSQDAGSNQIDKTGPSVFYGWKTVGRNDHPDSRSSGSVTEEYVENAGTGSQNWGGGIIAEKSFSVADDESTLERNVFGELVDPPHDKDASMCGDGRENDGYDTTAAGREGCPKDYGMVEEIKLDSFSHNGDSVKYDVDLDTRDLECTDAHGSKTYNANTSSGTQSYSDNADKTGEPDFFRMSSGHQIGKIGCSYTYRTAISAKTDYNLDENTFSNSGVEESSTTGTFYTAGGSSTTDVCVDRSDAKSMADDGLNGKSKQVTPDSNKHDLAGAGNLHYSETTTDQSLSLTLEWDEKVEGSKTWYDCDKYESYYASCDGSAVPDGDCSTVEKQVTYYPEKTYYGDEAVEGNTVTVKWKDYSIDQSGTSILDTHSSSSKDTVLGETSYSKSNFIFSDTTSGYYVDVEDDGKDHGNDPANSFNRYNVKESVDSNDRFIAENQERNIVDADGSKGQSDGFIAIDKVSGGWEVAGNTSGFLGSEFQRSGSDGFVGESDVPVPACPRIGDGGPRYQKCVASVDVYTKDSGWTSGPGSAGFEFVAGNPYPLNQSLGVCEFYRRATGNDDAQCQYDTTDNDGEVTPTGSGVCGDQPGERWVYMKGPEVESAHSTDYPAYYQACVTDSSSCVVGGSAVGEGTVSNVASPHNSGFEKGGDSPDAEACLDIDSDTGGEWYDLDSETAQSYLRGSGNGLTSGDSNGDGSTDSSDISYYWNNNPNPAHSDYNPEGDSSGTALEDDCGNSRYSENDDLDCNDAGSAENGDPTFYSFFETGPFGDAVRDDDFHPQGNDADRSGFFSGYIVKLQDSSDQLEPGMDTSTYSMMGSSDPLHSALAIWNDSRGGQDYADQWAIAENTTWSVSSKGVPYPPWGTYYSDPSAVRGGPDSESVSKADRAFGNSYAAVDSDWRGVWIDPDSIRKARQSGSYRWPDGIPDWRQALEFNMDITGPDAGLGFDAPDQPLSFSGGQSQVAWGDIYWEGEKDGETEIYTRDISENNYTLGDGSEYLDSLDGKTEPELEPPMCGDDRSEFLLEEVGDSSSPARFDGHYACASVRTYCVDLDSSPRLVDKDSYKNAGEPDEDVGRLKDDEEYCQVDRRYGLDAGVWWDQDLGDVDDDGTQETCRQNTLYGNEGVRWFSRSYVSSHPHAVTGGIDDDWNQFLDQQVPEGDSLESKPGRDSWDFSKHSPVPSGSPNKSIATLGFCGGDDDGEFLVRQQCNAPHCGDRNDVLGVTKVPGSCVLDGSRLNLEDDSNEERKLYSPGESVTVVLSGDRQEMSCFNGVWYEKWPVVFQEARVEIEKGNEVKLSFSVINIENEPRTFEVELENSKYGPLVDSFPGDGDKFTTTVPAQDSKAFQVDLHGYSTDVGSESADGYYDLTVQAVSTDSDISGEDSVGVKVVEEKESGKGDRRGEPRNVPGIGAIQLLAIMLLSTLFYFSQS